MDFHDFPRIFHDFPKIFRCSHPIMTLFIPSPCPRRGRALRHLGCRCNGRGRAGAEVGSCDLNCWQLTISRFFSRGHIWVVHIMHSIVPYYTILYIHIYNYIYIHLLNLIPTFFWGKIWKPMFFWWSHKNICYSIKTYVFSDPHVLRCFNMFQLSPMGFDSINIHIYSCPKGLIFLQDGCYRTCSGSGHIARWWLKLNIISIGQVGMGGTK